MRLLTLIAAVLLAVGCGPSTQGAGDMCGDGKLPEGAACTAISDCCPGMFCASLGPTPMQPVCCHTTQGVPCDAGACCPSRVETSMFRMIPVVLTVAACGGSMERPDVVACKELAALTLPLCEEINAHNTVQVDCSARFFGGLNRSCDQLVEVRDMDALELRCLPTMRKARIEIFSGGGGWYDWPESCQDQLRFPSEATAPR